MTKIGVRNVATADLKPNPRNPRNIQDSVEPVAKSIEEFGFLVPIVINEDNMILSGHARHAAAVSLGMDKVPTVLAKGLSKEQETAFMLADNRLSENASYNNEQLAELLKELTGANYNVLLTGFQSEEVDAFITSATSGLDDILGLGEDEEEEDFGSKPEEDDSEDVRHMHRLMFLLTADQKIAVMEAIDSIKKSSNTNLTNGEALTKMCLTFKENTDVID